MSLLISIHEIHKSFASKTLFEGLSFGIHEGDRIGIIGNNGVGKSTLLKILGAGMEVDQGQVSRRKFLKMAYVEQDTPFTAGITVEDYMLIKGRDCGLAEADLLIEASTQLSKAGFDKFDVKIDTLSGGWKKRLAIAGALLGSPDLLFLDEPTNHLDFDGVLWLEALLKGSPFAWVMISHDRYFLDRTVTKIAEVNKVFSSGIFIQSCSYSDFLGRKQDYLDGLAKQEEALSNKVRREVEWLRRGPKARSTKARYRIEDAQQMIADLSQLRQKLKTDESQIAFDATGRKTKRLLVAKDISKTFGERVIFKQLNLVLSPGLVVGVLGKNGCGKSTLLKALQKLISLDAGDLIHAPQLNIVYFDQNREALDPQMILKEALSEEGGDSVIYQDRSLHIVAWARMFQFTNEQLTQKVGSLSGGEQARIMIARLMQKKADILILDEPTNDLDIQTLDLLEESLASFPGSIVLVSHDRYMVSRLADICVGFLGEGETALYADYAQWEKEFKQINSGDSVRKKSTPKEKVQRTKKKVKLSYMEQREYDRMEDDILQAEGHLQECTSKIEDPLLASDPAAMNQASDQLRQAQEAVDSLYARWTELEEKQQH